MIARACVVIAALLLSACLPERPVREAELPPSHRDARLSEYQPPEILDHLAEWYPGDWRVHLLRGLTDTSRDSRIASLRRADSLRPGDPLPAYHLALAYIDRDSGRGDAAEVMRALPHLERARSLDPGNGVLDVMRAYLHLRRDELPQARALFLDPRRVPRGDFHHARLEEVVLGLLSHAGQLNPYSLTEAAALYRGVPLPPFEKMVDILYAVFLSPQESHPYDIRMRGRDAALAVFRLGRNLRTDSYAGPRVFSDGYEQRALGFMFQLRAGEFLTLFHRTFEDPAASRRSFDELVAVQAEYEAFMASGAWEDGAVTAYLDGWSALFRDHPDMTVGEAAREARAWTLWRRAEVFRYPARDDRP